MTTTVYRMYDAQERRLYVGMTDGAFMRLSSHADKSKWAQLTTKITLERFEDRALARAAESAAIRDEDPVFNVGGRPRKRSMQWAIAYPDWHADDVTDEVLFMKRRGGTSMAERFLEAAADALLS